MAFGEELDFIIIMVGHYRGHRLVAYIYPPANNILRQDMLAVRIGITSPESVHHTLPRRPAGGGGGGGEGLNTQQRMGHDSTCI